MNQREIERLENELIEIILDEDKEVQREVLKLHYQKLRDAYFKKQIYKLFLIVSVIINLIQIYFLFYK